ncbi:hypothetical protein LH51_05485 [Nitrincola sp. A-D6]|nr:hypothetical protein LH51_05485 [Nitrincola sp. A-D6]
MQSGLSVAEYRDQHQSLIQDWLNEQAPGLAAVLMPVYQQTGEPGARLAMGLNLEGVDLQALNAPDYRGEVLSRGMSLSVNDQSLTLKPEQLERLWVLMQEPVVLESQVNTQESEASELAGMPRVMPGVASAPVAPAVAAEPLEYRRTDPLDLENYIGHPVRFYTSFGKRVEGILVSVKDGNARVAERVQHGTAQYPVELETLQATEVFR